jgi:hypothetical protein
MGGTATVTLPKEDHVRLPLAPRTRGNERSTPSDQSRSDPAAALPRILLISSETRSVEFTFKLLNGVAPLGSPHLYRSPPGHP